jgi:acyl dehydratase
MSEPPLPWQAGQDLPSLTLAPVARLDLIKYAGASGDYNPIHTIDEAAAEAGLPGVIQHGMLTMARIGLLFSPYLDRGYLARFTTRFLQMVRVGDVLTVGGRVVGVEETAGGTAYQCEVFARNQDGQRVAAGTATFVVPPGAEGDGATHTGAWA